MPHTMKKYIFCTIAIVLFLLSACKQNSEEPQSSPRIYMSYFVSFPSGGGKVDTLELKTDKGRYVVDTISVGDTVRFDLLLNAVTNTLTSFVFKNDTNYLNMHFNVTADLQKSLTDDTKLTDGALYFQTGYSAAIVPMIYIARKSGTTDVDMTLSSTSTYSPATLSFTQPIR